jgi:hypothetical protein
LPRPSGRSSAGLPNLRTTVSRSSGCPFGNSARAAAPVARRGLITWFPISP